MTDERRKLALPDRRKNTYEELEKRLDNHVAQIEIRFSRWLVRGLIAFAIIALASTVALAGFGIVLREQGHQADRLQTQADLIQKQADQIQKQADQIQEQRKTAIREACEQTNTRHDTTYASLVAAAKVDQRNAPTAAAKEEVRRRRDVTLALIDLMSPKDDCEKLVQSSVQTGGTP